MKGNGWATLAVKIFVDSGEAETKTGPFGTQLKASDYVEHGTPVINVRNIGFGTIKPEKLEYLAPETVKRLSSHLLQTGDIVFGRKGAVERHVLIRPEQNAWFQGSDCLRLRFTSKRIDPRFVSYFLLTDEHKQWMMNQCSHGATMASLNQDIIWRINLHFPPFPTQRKIAAILSAYDDLIENNTRRIAILEEMAQAIYREWFVNFRFPGHEKVNFIDSSLGKIPEGWKIGTINDVVRLLSGFAFKSGTFVDDGEYRLVTIKNVHDGRFVEESDSLLDALPHKMPDHCHLSSGDILLSLTGNIGRTCIVYGSGFLLNQRVAKLSSVNAADKGYVYCLFRSPDTQLRLSNIANGVAQQNLSPVQTGQLPHPLPPRSLLDVFAETLTPLFWNIVQLYRKNSNLRKTRDLLLPKLISGQLDVEELDIETGEPLVEAEA